MHRGAVIVGGGGAPTTTPTSAPSCPLWWITGTADTSDGYDAFSDARRGAGTGVEEDRNRIER